MVVVSNCLHSCVVLMASGRLLPLLLLLGCCSASNAASSLCSITCSTDYQESVNCSCSRAAPPLPVLVRVSCRTEDLNVSGTCSITPPLPWCLMQMEDLYDVASVGTKCTAAVSQPGGAAAETSSWELADVVKPSAPFHVRVTEVDELFNITWSVTSGNRLIYNVCIRESSRLLENGSRCFELEEQSLQLGRRQLQSLTAAGFVVHVQAKIGPGNYLQGPWSEWSPAAAWRPSRVSTAVDGVSAAWWFVSLPVVFILGLVLLVYLHKPCWQKKLELITFVPKPDHFFEPLYQNYQGNFKDWVKSAFSEYDYFHVVPHLEELQTRKRLNVLLWNDVDGLPQRPLQDGGTSPSIHTVTLSGEDYGDDSQRSYSEGEDGRRDAAEASARHDDGERLEENLCFPLLANEAERASLDSFASASRHSEDGYPHVDLDTIDSGFGDCSSPGAQRAEQEAELFTQHQPSNYVKQWILSGGVQDDGRQETLSDSGC